MLYTAHAEAGAHTPVHIVIDRRLAGVHKGCIPVVDKMDCVVDGTNVSPTVACRRIINGGCSLE